MRCMSVCGVVLALALMAAPAVAQIAFFDFNGDLVSTDVDDNSVTSVMTTPLGFIFGSSRFCVTSAWASSSPQGPFNGSLAFLEFSVTPEPGASISYTTIEFETWRGGGNPDYIEFAGLYADEDPGAGGDNFQTLVDSTDIFPQASGLGLASLDLSGAAFLQNATDTVTFRIYLWGDASSGTSNAEINHISLEGVTDVCVGPPATINSVPCGFSSMFDPILTVNPLVQGDPLTLVMDSVFPNVPMWIFASIGPPVNTVMQGCNFGVDPSALIILIANMTDENGDFTLQTPYPIPEVLVGLQISFQARVCDQSGQVMGPFAPLPDFFSNSIHAVIGCY